MAKSGRGRTTSSYKGKSSSRAGTPRGTKTIKAPARGLRSPGRGTRAGRPAPRSRASSTDQARKNTPLNPSAKGATRDIVNNRAARTIYLNKGTLG